MASISSTRGHQTLHEITMEGNIKISISLPFDVALKIASSLLDHQDVCALGSCSMYWRQICGSDPIWISLSNKRWPSLFTHPNQLLDQPHHSDPLIHDWKGFYAKRHKEIAKTSAIVVSFINQSTFESNSIDLRGYRKVFDQLALVQFGFNDVESFLFDSEISVILNLLGLHYSIKCLKVPPEVAMEALRRRKIYERGFKIECIKLVRQNFQCTLVSERQSRSFSLHNLAMADRDIEEEDEVLRMLELDCSYDWFVDGKIFPTF